MKDTKENIHKNHRERMRNKAIKHGFETFENHELLEFLLFYPNKRIDTNPIAHKLLNKCENFLGVLTADEKDLKSVEGVGERAVLFIKALKELYARTIIETKKSVKFNSKLALKEYTISLFKFCTTEILYAICLDKNMFHIANVELSNEGKIGEAKVDIVEAVVKILSKKPKYVILAHNHTDDNLSISNDDGVFTVDLYKRLIEYNIILTDHIIVSGDNVTTFDELGVMDKVKAKASEGKPTGAVSKSTPKVSSSFFEFDPDFDKFT